VITISNWFRIFIARFEETQHSTADSRNENRRTHNWSTKPYVCNPSFSRYNFEQLN